MKPNFITNNDGEKIGVILSMKEYSKIIDELEMLEDIKLYDKIKSRKESSISLQEYKKSRSDNV